MASVFLLCNNQCVPGEGKKGQRALCQVAVEEKFGQIRIPSTGVWPRDGHGGCEECPVY